MYYCSPNCRVLWYFIGISVRVYELLYCVYFILEFIIILYNISYATALVPFRHYPCHGSLQFSLVDFLFAHCYGRAIGKEKVNLG